MPNEASQISWESAFHFDNLSISKLEIPRMVRFLRSNLINVAISHYALPFKMSNVTDALEYNGTIPRTNPPKKSRMDAC